MRCQECGVRQSAEVEDCPFCGYQVALQAASCRQKALFRWVFLSLRLLVLLIILAVLYYLLHCFHHPRFDS